MRKKILCLLILLFPFLGFAQERSIPWDGTIAVYVADDVLTKVTFPSEIKRISQAFSDAGVKTISMDWIGRDLYLKPLQDPMGRSLFSQGNCFIDTDDGASYALAVTNIRVVDTGKEKPDMNLVITPGQEAISKKDSHPQSQIVDILRAVFIDQPLPGMKRFTDSQGKTIVPDDTKLGQWLQNIGLEIEIDKIYTLTSQKIVAFSSTIKNKSNKPVVIPFDQLWWPNLRYSTLDPFVKAIEPGAKVRFYAYFTGVEKQEQLIVPFVKEK